MRKLGPSQKPVVMPGYPHMLHGDNIVWSRYLSSNHNKISELWYDVHVGMAVEVPAGASRMIKAISDGLTRKRIDVVAKVGIEYWIIEVKPRAGMMAVGQVLTYKRLFLKEYKTERLVKMVIVCESMDPDIEDELKEFRIDLVKI